MDEKKFKKAKHIERIINGLNDILDIFPDLNISDERKWNRYSIFAKSIELLSEDKGFSKHFKNFIENEIKQLENEFKNL